VINRAFGDAYTALFLFDISMTPWYKPMSNEKNNDHVKKEIRQESIIHEKT